MPEDYARPQTVHDTHPQGRSGVRSACYQRGFHYGEPSANGGFSECVDCGTHAMPGGLTFRDVAQDVSRRMVHTEIPEVLTHNPNASFPELMAERMKTTEERAASRKGNAEPEIVVSQKQAMAIGLAYLSQMKTRENIIKWCGELGIHLVDPEGVSGVNVNLHGQLVGALGRADKAESELATVTAALDAVTAEKNAAITLAADLQAKVDALLVPPDDPTNNQPANNQQEAQ